MKIHFGNRTPIEVTSNQGIANRVQAAILEAAKGKVVKQGGDYAENLKGAIYATALDEAGKLFTTLATKIDQNPSGSGFGLTPEDLLAGTNPAQIAMFSDLTSGSVSWKPLSLKYQQEKARHFASFDYRWKTNLGRTKGLDRKDPKFTVKAVNADANRFFFYNGYLQAWFRSNGATIATNRLGGVNIEVSDRADGEGLYSGKGVSNAQLEAAKARVDKGLNSSWYDYIPKLEPFLLKNFKITIFPDIATSLLPGLAAHRWSQVLDTPEVEKWMFADTKAGYKLAQGRRGGTYDYRALVAPAVQFWMLVRIPAAIVGRVKLYFGRADILRQS